MGTKSLEGVTENERVRSIQLQHGWENHDHDSDDVVIREAEGGMPALPGVQAGTKLQSNRL